MDLVDLVLTVCLVADPTSCRNEHLYFESRGNLLQCMFLAPAEIARWSGTHPTLQVARWKCAFADRGQDI